MTFASRYGTNTYDNQPNECPDEMYPWTVEHRGETHDTFDEFKDAAAFDSLNVPISWFFHPADDGDLAGVFELVYTMPRKHGRTWSMCLAPGFDRGQVEAWLEEFTKEFAAAHFGWSSPVDAAEEPTS